LVRENEEEIKDFSNRIFEEKRQLSERYQKEIQDLKRENKHLLA